MARVNCKKGYNLKEGYVEFKNTKNGEVCPISGEGICKWCDIKSFISETKNKKPE